MTRGKGFSARAISLVLVVVIACLAGCAAKKELVVPEARVPQKAGMLFEYMMPAVGGLKYQTTQHLDQNLEVMGQATQMTMMKTMAFSMVPKGRTNDVYTLEVTVDSMAASLTIPQGEFNADVAPVIGKTFDMTVSNKGKEIDWAGADAIKFGIGPQGERSISSDFQAILPDLPDVPVEVGDTWTTLDTVRVTEDAIETRLVFENVNTLEGLETVDGLECARISVVVKGTLTGGGEQRGMDMTFDGTMQGTETWYFAQAKGLFVRSSSSVAGDATITISGMQNMTIPMKQNVETETRLIQ